MHLYKMWRHSWWLSEKFSRPWGVQSRAAPPERNQLRWLGHLVRKPPGRLPREEFQAHPAGRRPWGRPRPRWPENTSRQYGQYTFVERGSVLLHIVAQIIKMNSVCYYKKIQVLQNLQINRNTLTTDKVRCAFSGSTWWQKWMTFLKRKQRLMGSDILTRVMGDLIKISPRKESYFLSN